MHNMSMEAEHIAKSIAGAKLDAQQHIPHFSKLPLDPSHQATRVWRFHPSATPDNLILDLAICPLGQENPHFIPYTALSYVWGSSDNSKLVHLKDSTSTCKITTNLHTFLQHLLSSSTERPKWFWADQISINQSDLRERSQQVRLMGTVYSRASAVYAFLGAAPPNFASKDFIPTPNGKPKFRPEKGHVLACLDLFTRPYWTRLWIVQELHLASQLVFWIGRTAVEGQALHTQIEGLSALHPRFFTDLMERVQRTPVHSERYRAFVGQQLDSTILSLLKRQDQTRMRLLEVLTRYTRTECSDPRDKVFGLQALVKPGQKVVVDYAKTMQDVSREVSIILIMDLIEREDVLPLNRRDRQVAFFDGLILTRAGKVADLLASIQGLLALPVEELKDDVAVISWSFIVRHLGRLFRYVESTADPSAFWTFLIETAQTPRQKAFARELHAKFTTQATFGTSITLRDKFETAITFRAATASEADELIEEELGKQMQHLLLGTALMTDYVIEGSFVYHPKDWEYPGRKKDRQEGIYYDELAVRRKWRTRFE